MFPPVRKVQYEPPGVDGTPNITPIMARDVARAIHEGVLFLHPGRKFVSVFWFAGDCLLPWR